jgi:hypothetical protein
VSSTCLDGRVLFFFVDKSGSDGVVVDTCNTNINFPLSNCTGPFSSKAPEYCGTSTLSRSLHTRAMDHDSPTVTTSNLVSLSLDTSMTPSFSGDSLFGPTHVTPSSTIIFLRSVVAASYFRGISVSSAVVVYGTLAVGSGVSAALARGSVPALQRASVTLQLAAVCAGANSDPMTNAPSENPLHLRFDVGQTEYQFAAGAAVGNTFLVLAVCIASHGTARLVQVCGEPLASDMGLLPKLHRSVIALVLAVLPSSRLPGAIAIPYSVLVQPTVAACVALFMSGDAGGGGATAVGVGFAVLWLSAPLFFGRAILWSHRAGRTSTTTRATCSDVPRSQFRFQTCRVPRRRIESLPKRLFTYAAQPTEVWVRPRRQDASSSPASLLAFERLEAVFESYVARREWYFLVDWGLAIVSGVVVGAARVMATEGYCGAAVRLAAWGGVVLSAAQALLCAALRPMQVRLEVAVCIVVGVLSIVSQVLVLVDMPAAADRVGVAASALQLVAVAMIVLCEALGDTRMALRRSAGGEYVVPANRRGAPGTSHEGLRCLIGIICRRKCPDGAVVNEVREALAV